MKYLKTFEEGIYNNREKLYIDPEGNKHMNLKRMLCIDNRISELEDVYDLTTGNIYKIKNKNSYMISFIDDNGHELFFNPSEIYKNFSTAQSLEEYEITKNTEKFNL